LSRGKGREDWEDEEGLEHCIEEQGKDFLRARAGTSGGVGGQKGRAPCPAAVRGSRQSPFLGF